MGIISEHWEEFDSKQKKELLDIVNNPSKYEGKIVKFSHVGNVWEFVIVSNKVAY